MFGMRRREFMILVGGGAVVSVISPTPLCAQQTGKVYHVGFLSTGSGPNTRHEAFEASLGSLGYHVT